MTELPPTEPPLEVLIPKVHHPLKWIFPKEDPAFAAAIVQEFNIHPVIAQVLISRRFTTIDEIHHFLYAKLPNLHAPELLLEMDVAIHRLVRGLRTKENILIYGDNDVDGMTGTALLVEFLRFLGGSVYYYVPNRSLLKQSIMADALAFAKARKTTLIVTTDCGITAGAEIKTLVENGVDVIITDHHEPTAPISHCIATLNPKLLHSTYPNRDLTGVGVAFKLAHGLTNFLTKRGLLSPARIDLKQYLDLVALGTIADMAVLRGENRILVRYGLKALSSTRRIGLKKLLAMCEIKEEELTTTDVASKIAPRLNSLGRIDDPQKGVALLLAHDPKEAETLVQDLDANNIARQKIEKKDSQDVEKMLKTSPQILDDKALILDSKKWHPGIIPILSARLAKQYNRPVIIIAIDEGIGKGSSRTIPEYPLLPSLHACSDLLENFGGHNYAAGFAIREEKIPEFKGRFIALANGALQDQDLTPKLHLDAPIDFAELTFDFLESMKLLEPYGMDNAPPVFYGDAKQTWPPKVVGKTHLKLYLEQKDRILEGIAFGFAKRRQEICQRNLELQVAFTPYVNTYFNKSSIQLLIRDFRGCC